VAQGRSVTSPTAALGVQPKLQINTPGDRYEQEADAVASAVTGGTPAPAISKLPPGGLASGVPSGASSAPAQRESLQRETTEEEPTQMQSEDEAEPVQMKEDEAEPVQMAEEEESVQMAEEEEAVQMMEEEEPAQMQELEDESAQMQELEDETAQAKEGPGGSAGGGRSASAAATASRAMSQAGAGSPLPSPVRSQIEGSTGRDFSGVRIHDGAAAQSAASAINARAFTRGSDIYLGQGASPNDTQLMAHEATHVVQQSAAPPTTSNAQRQPIQRQETEDEPVQMQETEEPVQRADEEDDESNGASSGASVTPSEAGTREGNRLRVHFNSVNVPAFKATAPHRKRVYDSHMPAWRHRGYTRGSTKQRKVWLDTVDRKGTEDKVQEKIDNATAGYESEFGTSTYLFKTFLNGGYVAGSSKEDVAQQLLIPSWGQTGREQEGALVPRIGGKNKIFHVDHIVELQLAGWDKSKKGPSWANSKENMELLLGSKNLASGPKIESNIANKARAYAETVENENSVFKDHRRVLAGLNLYFHNIGSGESLGVTQADYWTLDEIESGKHLAHPDALQLVTGDDVNQDGTVLILSSESGPFGRRFPTSGSLQTGQKGWLSPFEITDVQFNTGPASARAGGDLGTFTVKIPSNVEGLKAHADEEVALDVKRLGVAQYVGHFKKADVERLVEEKIDVSGSSPIRVYDLQIDPETGLIVRAQLLPTVPLIGDADIQVTISDGELSISKTFGLGDYQFPGPVQVTQSSLTMSYGSNQGIALDGRTDLKIENVGTGYLEGGASTSAGFHVAGGFDFDTELFSEASIDLGYHKAPDEEAVFTGSGTLAIGRSKVKGIKSASIDVTVENESWTADGTVEPEINGIREGTLTAAYAPETGFAIDGSLSLSEDVPGIRGGTLEAGVRKRESGDGYKIRASGEADLDIPGVSSRIGVTYDDGLFTAQTTVGYERGMLSGRLTAGITNQPLGDDGQPAGGEDAADPGNDLRAFGGGEMTLGLAPWLQATAGVQLLPNGEVEMRGEIGIPEVIELFPERRYERRLFTVGLDIPIVGVAVAGQRIGIFATVNGGLDATASIGPGELRDANLAVEYNPDREDETTVTGHALFVIPAFAGLRLFVRGGLGAGIPIVSAEAGLEVGGQIGLQGAAEAEADVNWNPQSGLALHAEGHIFAEPSFLFDVSGYANVSANLVFTTVDLYDERFTLASYEWGSGMRVGVIFPVDYREGEPFSLSTDDIEFVYPQINPRAIITDLVDEVA
jgi:hypothetical protein